MAQSAFEHGYRAYRHGYGKLDLWPAETRRGWDAAARKHDFDRLAAEQGLAL